MKLGFIGCGNMASAMMSGIVANGIVEAKDIIGADPFAPSREKVQAKLGIRVTEQNKEVVEASDVFVLSVKPQCYEAVIAEIRDYVREDQIVVTLAPGKTLDWLETQFQKPVKIIRTMPNTPAMVLEGMTGACPNSHVTEEETQTVIRILNGFGNVEVVPETLMDAVVAVSGSAPAYVFMLIEAMIEGAVAEGMPKEQAKKFAAKAVLGSARMVLETDREPRELREMVCSPGGTTIEAVKVLEEQKFQRALTDAMKACAEKSRRL